MLRVLQVTLDQHYEPLAGGGGVARYIHGLASELAAAGVEVTVAARTVDRTGLPYKAADAVGLALIPHIRNADVVHLHGPRRPEMFVTAVLCRLLGRPFVFTPHAYYAPVRPAGGPALAAWKLRAFAKAIYNQTLERFLLTAGYRTILLNEYWMGHVRQELGLPTNRTVVLPNCTREADLSRATGPVSPLSGEPSILSVGRLDEVKCLDDVIRALSLPELRQAVFHVVGKGPDRQRLEELAAAENVADRVRFYGVVDDADVAVMAAGCGVFILPARQEGMPSVIIEMLLRGTPVVSSDIPGSRAIMDLAGADGLYPLNDIPALARAVVDLAGKPPPAGVLARVSEKLTWESRVHDFIDLYRAAAGSAPA